MQNCVSITIQATDLEEQAVHGWLSEPTCGREGLSNQQPHLYDPRWDSASRTKQSPETCNQHWPFQVLSSLMGVIAEVSGPTLRSPSCAPVTLEARNCWCLATSMVNSKLFITAYYVFCDQGAACNISSNRQISHTHLSNWSSSLPHSSHAGLELLSLSFLLKILQPSFYPDCCTEHH